MSTAIITRVVVIESLVERQLSADAQLAATGWTYGTDFLFFYGYSKLQGISPEFTQGDACGIDTYAADALRPGEIACAESHIRLWEGFAIGAQVGDILLVMEDDVTMIKNRNDFISIIRDAPPKWELIQFHEGGLSWDDEKIANKGHTRSLLKLDEPSYGTVCYALNYEAVLKLVKRARPIGSAIDVYLKFFGLNAYKTKTPYTKRHGVHAGST